MKRCIEKLYMWFGWSAYAVGRPFPQRLERTPVYEPSYPRLVALLDEQFLTAACMRAVARMACARDIDGRVGKEELV